MKTNLDQQITLPIRCISYYASDKSSLDNKEYGIFDNGIEYFEKD